MPSHPANVHRTQQRLGQHDHAKTGDFASTGRKSPAGFEHHLKAGAIAVDGEPCQAERDLAAAVASSSNAAEMSPMLITPIRLKLSITGRWRMWFLFIR